MVLVVGLVVVALVVVPAVRVHQVKVIPAVMRCQANLENLWAAVAAQVDQAETVMHILAAQVEQVLMMVLVLREPVVVVAAA
jgi:hypothetical protein